MDFRDARLATLAQRMKARSFPQMMAPQEQACWQDHVRDKLLGEGDWLNLAGFRQRLRELEGENLSTEKLAVLRELSQYGAELEAKYQVS